MARGVRKTLEEKIDEKRELIGALEIRLDKEKKELEALLGEQKQQEVESLYHFLKESNLTIDKATEILRTQTCMG